MASITKVAHSDQLDASSDLPAERFSSEAKQTSLPKVLGARDLTLFSLMTVVTLGSMTFIHSGGPATLLFVLLGLPSFVGPHIITLRWLSRRSEEKKTQHLWVTSGKYRSGIFFSSLCIWWPGILIVTSTTQAYTELSRLSMQPSSNSSSPLQQGITIIGTLFLIALVACIPMRRLKNIIMAIAIPYLSIFCVVGCAGIWWLVSGHATAFSFTSWNQWHVTSDSVTAFGQAVMAVLVVHTPHFLSQEIKASNKERQRITVSRFLWWSSILVCVVMLLGTVGIMVIVPPAQMGTLTALVYAVKSVFGSSSIPFVIFILNTGQIAIAVVALLVYSRILVVLAQKKMLPQQLTRVNCYGVPILSILVQAMIAAVFSVLLFIVAPNLINHISVAVKMVLGIDDYINVNIYHVLQIGTLALLACESSMVYAYVVVILYKSRRDPDMPLKQRMLKSLGACIGLCTVLIAAWVVLTHSPLPNRFSDTSWTISVIVVIASIIVFGWFVSSLPHLQASLQEQRRLNAQEANLRFQLQESYAQQQVLLEEVDHLYREHALAAVTDAITGLPNHRAVMSKIDDILIQCQQKQQSCAILFTDLDHFKRVNDTWGHRAGDAILREVARRFRVTLRERDLVGRYGGEEFAIVLQETELEEATHIAERLRAAVNIAPCAWQEDGQVSVSIPVTTSIGVAVYQLHGVTRETLITSADQAMYRAKRTGRNLVCIADVEQEGHESVAVPHSVTNRRSSEDAAVNALIAAASARDSETHEHAQRMVRLAEATARQLTRSEEEVHLIQLAALLHDIGKIGIPDAILHKPGPLTSDEWTVMRSHPDIGRSILEQTGGILRLLANIVVAHHERWDGTGYPLQMAGENIPLGARILSVVDSYDAVISKRAYREARSIDEAKAELQHCAGSQFDPQVVNAFLIALAEQEGRVLVESASAE